MIGVCLAVGIIVFAVAMFYYLRWRRRNAMRFEFDRRQQTTGQVVISNRGLSRPPRTHHVDLDAIGAGRQSSPNQTYHDSAIELHSLFPPTHASADPRRRPIDLYHAIDHRNSFQYDSDPAAAFDVTIDDHLNSQFSVGDGHSLDPAYNHTLDYTFEHPFEPVSFEQGNDYEDDEHEPEVPVVPVATISVDEDSSQEEAEHTFGRSTNLGDDDMNMFSAEANEGADASDDDDDAAVG